jgi:hypothetical protein
MTPRPREQPGRPDRTDRPGRSGPDRLHWYDDEAGPLVRLYALTRGRTRPVYEVFDVITLVRARSDPRSDPTLGPEQISVLETCRSSPRSVADLAADLDLPLGVTRVILSDLLAVGHIQVAQPVTTGRLPDENLLREVINGLRAL